MRCQRLRARCLLAAFVAIGLLCASGCKQRVVLGKQCPSPASGRATVQGDPGGDYELAAAYGTTCAPCDDGDEIELDDDGCPVFVTFDGCGGDICLGGVRVFEHPPDAGMVGDDASAEPGDAAAGEDAAAEADAAAEVDGAAEGDGSA